MKNNSLFSDEFNDLYSSSNGAIEECEYVFIKGNNLRARFSHLQPGKNFYIGEIGFGIGLNFLTTCKNWLEHSKENNILEFYSFDKYLFNLNDFKTLAENSPEFKKYSTELARKYPLNLEGIQKISLFEGRVSLNLIIGDINQTQDYIGLIKKVDAWFFDGFSPSKNPDLWSKKLFCLIGSTCHDESTFSTYTSSGLVKNNLKESGFSYKKVEGFSGKRHMLIGNANAKPKRESHKKKVAVIGSGITGCMLSYMLAKKGIEVDLFEQSETICSAASSHELLVTYPRLSAHDTAYGRFNLQSYIYATNFYNDLNSDAWKRTGVLLLNHDAETKKRQASLLEKRSDGKIYQFLNIDEVAEKSGLDIGLNGLLFKDAGYILPNEMCKFLIESSKINLITSANIEHLIRNEDSISFSIKDKKFEYEDVCLCTGSDTTKLINLKGFNVKRGQVTHIQRQKNISGINLPICAKGYISPLINNIHIVGSSYSEVEHMNLTEAEHSLNLDNLKVIFDDDVKIESGRVGLRAVSKDHMPIVGEQDGIYINTCHGSRASITAPISAALISSFIANETPPLDKREIASLSPERFN